jgi:hypothetical protein
VNVEGYRFYRDRDGCLCRRAILDADQELLSLGQVLGRGGKWVYYTLDLPSVREISEEEAIARAGEADIFAPAHGPSGDHLDEVGPENDFYNMGPRGVALYEELRVLERPAKEQKRELTLDEAKGVAALSDEALGEMRAVYEEAWRRSLEEASRSRSQGSSE